MHGVVLTDDYAWLRDKENPDVTAYLEAENAYAEAVMAPLEGLREKLYEQMLSHVKQTDVSVPYRDGYWWYYSRTEEGLQYAIYCRKRRIGFRAVADAAEEVLLDGNGWQRATHFSRSAIPTLPTTADGWPHHGHEGIPPVHAAHQGPRNGRDAFRRSRTRRLCSLGGRQYARCSIPWRTSSRSGNTSFGGPRRTAFCELC